MNWIATFNRESGNVRVLSPPVLRFPAREWREMICAAPECRAEGRHRCRECGDAFCRVHATHGTGGWTCGTCEGEES